MNRLKALLADDEGATAIEYGLIAALIAIACIIAFQTLGLELTASSTASAPPWRGEACDAAPRQRRGRRSSHLRRALRPKSWSCSPRSLAKRRLRS
jgi:pilus assembly protein Flp/PilA